MNYFGLVLASACLSVRNSRSLSPTVNCLSNLLSAQSCDKIKRGREREKDHTAGGDGLFTFLAEIFASSRRTFYPVPNEPTVCKS